MWNTCKVEEREQLVKYLAYHPFESELTVIAEECDVNIVAHAHQPEWIAQEPGYEPCLANQPIVEEQLDEVQQHQWWKECIEMYIKGIAPLDIRL